MSRGVIEAWNEHQQKTMPMLFRWRSARR